jgi:hypothetical protein
MNVNAAVTKSCQLGDQAARNGTEVDTDGTNQPEYQLGIGRKLRSAGLEGRLAHRWPELRLEAAVSAAMDVDRTLILRRPCRHSGDHPVHKAPVLTRVRTLATLTAIYPRLSVAFLLVRHVCCLSLW